MRNRLVEIDRKGTKVFAIQDKETGLFWQYVYKHRSFAKRMAIRVHPEGELDTAVNWRKPGSYLHVSAREFYGR
jgi:hypothetical protein